MERDSEETTGLGRGGERRGSFSKELKKVIHKFMFKNILLNSLLSFIYIIWCISSYY